MYRFQGQTLCVVVNMLHASRLRPEQPGGDPANTLR